VRPGFSRLWGCVKGGKDGFLGRALVLSWASWVYEVLGVMLRERERDCLRWG
jgi:hypothetical protein